MNDTNSNQVIMVDESEIVIELEKVEKTSGINEDSALALRGQFADYYGEITEWREKAAMVTKPDDPTHQKIARDVRLGLRKVRCEVENTRKALKADSLARGKAIDGFANVLKYLCEPVEAQLLEVEQYAERMEAARIAAIVADRTAALVEVEADPTAYNLGAMDDDTFRLVLDAAKKRQAERIEAERQAEAERIAREQAEAQERERMRAENARLKAEAEAKEKELAAEREAREKAERDRARAQKLEADRIAKAKAEADAKAKAEREAAEKAARAPDRDRVMELAAFIRDWGVTLPCGKTQAGGRVLDDIMVKAEAFAVWIEKQAETL